MLAHGCCRGTAGSFVGQGQGVGGAEAYGGFDLDAPVRRWVGVEDDHLVVLAHFEHPGCLGLAHAVARSHPGAGA